jgi:hypothetical protein
MRSRTAAWCGALALLFFGVHAAVHVVRREPWDLLWSCNVACLLVGIGCVSGHALPVAIGVLWLSFGVPLWLIDLATGGAMLPTSPLTHVGGLALGLAGTRELGWPAGAWWKAVAGLGLLTEACRFVTPRAANVNLAFSVWGGWETRFPSHVVYLALLLVCASVVFFAVERAALKVRAR